MEAKKTATEAMAYMHEIRRLLDCAIKGDDPVSVTLAIMTVAKDYHDASHSALVAACDELLDALRRCHKTDPKMDGSRVVRGVDPVQFELLVLPAMDSLRSSLTPAAREGEAG